MLDTEALPDTQAAAPFAHRATAFGRRWQSDLPLHAFRPDPWPDEDASPVISVRLCDGPAPSRGPLRHSGRFHLRSDGFRYFAGEAATVDAYGKDRLNVHPGPAWAGVLPSGFFSSVAAMLMAANGDLPLHGSAVAIDGQATLVCGASGAGKSTTIAHLIERGALLISDDLTVLRPDPAGGRPTVSAGRRSMRLFPRAAEHLGQAVAWQAPPRPAEGKIAVFPPQVSPFCAVPLARVILLGHDDESIACRSKAELLAQQIFRAWLLDSKFGHGNRRAVLAIAARTLDFAGAPAL